MSPNGSKHSIPLNKNSTQLIISNISYGKHQFSKLILYYNTNISLIKGCYLRINDRKIIFGA